MQVHEKSYRCGKKRMSDENIFYFPVEQIFDMILQSKNWSRTNNEEYRNDNDDDGRRESNCFMRDTQKDLICEGEFAKFQTFNGKVKLMVCEKCFKSIFFNEYISSWMETEGDILYDKLIKEEQMLPLDLRDTSENVRRYANVVKTSKK